MSTPTPFLVELATIGANRGRGTLVAQIADAKDIGASEYANEAGECFFTLPITHPFIDACIPLQRHVRVLRWDGVDTYIPIWNGLLEDFEAGPDEVVFYGVDYLGLLQGTITQSNTSYTNEFIGNIVTAQISAAVNESNSRVGFIGLGSIDTTTTTSTLITSFEPRLQFLANALQILAADTTVRPIISVTPRTAAHAGAFSFTFDENQGADREDVQLAYGRTKGGVISRLRYNPGYADLATRINGIGVKREGATLLYSTQTYASETTYGHIARAKLYQDIVNQTALDKRTKRDARIASRIGKQVSLSLRVHGVVPWGGYDLGDSVRVLIDRGFINVNGLYTVWGQEWIGTKDGAEELYLDLLPKDE